MQRLLLLFNPAVVSNAAQQERLDIREVVGMKQDYTDGERTLKVLIAMHYQRLGPLVRLRSHPRDLGRRAGLGRVINAW